MQPQYPDVLYSTETAALIMSMVALQRADGVPVEQALDPALDRYWQRARGSGGSFTLDELRAFVRDTAAPR